MHELRRLLYLDALGIDSFESRRQLPGAAVTLRRAIPAKSCAPAAAPESAPSQDAVVTQAAVDDGGVRPVSVLVEPRVRARIEPNAVARPGNAPLDVVPRFSLVTLVAGDWLWLEELAGMPLTTEQVQLVQSMAGALLADRALRDSVRAAAQPDAARPGMPRTDAARPDVMQFDWPIHSNRQLDQGEAAAQAGVAGFLARRLEQRGSRGLVLLGQSGAARVPMRELGVVTVSTASSAQMLAHPALKRQAWRDLLPLIRQP